MKSKELKEKRADLLNKIDGLNALATTEKRELTDTELDTMDADVAEVEKLNGEIIAAEKREAIMAQSAARAVVTGIGVKAEEQVKEKFSFMTFINQAAQRNLTGLYAEMDQEARKEAQASGISMTGFGIPSFLLGTKRDMTAGTTTAGGFAIATQKMGLIEYLEAKTVLGQMGVDFMTGLVGNLSWPREDSSVSASWKTENATSGEVSPTMEEVTLSPKRLTTYVDVSNLLMKQTSPSIENRVRSRLMNALARGIEIAAINGSGSANDPKGILNTSGIGSVALGADGSTPTWASIVALWKEVAVDNADIGTLAYLTTPQAIYKLRTILKDSNVSGYLLGEGNVLNGYPIHFSNTVPSTLDKGASSSSLSAMIFGNWNDLVVGTWGGLDILVNPYTKGKEGLTEIIANVYCDVAVLRPQSFAAIVDITTS